jgi:hypothetical protein
MEPDTYKQLQKKLKTQTNKLDRFRARLVKALGAEPFVFTELDNIADQLDEIEFHLESRIYGGVS